MPSPATPSAPNAAASPAAEPGGPAVCVVVPTYNRAELLRRTLESLRRQRPGGPPFEVAVADDGSTDDTPEVVREFASQLPVRYHHQEDLGFRAGAARNGGARLATAPVLVFFDTGAVAGPDFVRAHYEAHRAPGAPARGRVVIGYTYGYNLFGSFPGLDELLAQHPPEEVLARLGDHPELRDMRHEKFAEVGFALPVLHAPWMLMWSVNFSVSAESFWAVGGFDESFRGWGSEDLELGYRLTRLGARFEVSRQAWAIEAPHGRDGRSIWVSGFRNVRRFLQKHPDPAVELFRDLAPRQIGMTLEEEYRNLLEWADKCHEQDVRDEIAAVLAGLDPARPPRSIGIFGCGGVLPEDGWPRDVRLGLADFDAELLRQVTERHPDASGAHTIGIHTPFPTDAFDLVIVTSRLAGIWPRWGTDIRAEASRVGREVRVIPDDDPPE